MDIIAFFKGTMKRVKKIWGGVDFLRVVCKVTHEGLPWVR